MPKRKEYIPSPLWFKEMYQQYPDDYTVMEKFPIETIKFDKQLLAYANDVNIYDVVYILMNFDVNAWEPIHINEDNYLLDGQHRLRVAKDLCLKYIDVIVRHHEI